MPMLREQSPLRPSNTRCARITELVSASIAPPTMRTDSPGRQIVSPLLVLWGSKDDLAELYDDDVLGIWRTWATTVSGRSINASHHMSEEAPEELTRALLAFFTSRPTGAVA